jgi:hypothetical protein
MVASASGTSYTVTGLNSSTAYTFLQAQDAAEIYQQQWSNETG